MLCYTLCYVTRYVNIRIYIMLQVCYSEVLNIIKLGLIPKKLAKNLVKSPKKNTKIIYMSLVLSLKS